MYYSFIDNEGIEYCLEPLLWNTWYVAKYKDEELLEPKFKIPLSEVPKWKEFYEKTTGGTFQRIENKK